MENGRVLKVVTAIGLIALCACSTQGARRDEGFSTFTEVKLPVGTEVTLVGVLSSRANDWSLYESSKAMRDEDFSLCVPVLIWRTEADLITTATQLHGRRVRVSGVVAPSSSDPEMDSILACRDVGIDVGTISVVD